MNEVQSSRKLLPVGSYTERLVSQVVNRVAGVQPQGVNGINEREVITELREEDPIIKVSQLIPGLMSWEGQPVNVSCVLSSKGSFLSII